MFSQNAAALLRRISARILGQPNLEVDLACYPSEISECWIWLGAGSTPIIRVGKSSTTVVRALIEIACGERLYDFWTPRRKQSCGSQRCVNPTHFELRPHNQNRYGMEGPLPGKLAPASPDEVQIVLDLLDDWEHPALDAFVKRCAVLHLSFSRTTIEAAYRTLTPT